MNYDFKVAWEAMVREHRNEFFMATEAYHQLGDISRDEPDYMRLGPSPNEDMENYYGAWVTGYGFVEVRFPKATTRPLTDEEFEWLAKHPAVIV